MIRAKISLVSTVILICLVLPTDFSLAQSQHDLEVMTTTSDGTQNDCAKTNSQPNLNHILGLANTCRHGMNKNCPYNRWKTTLRKGANRLCDLQADSLGDNAKNGYLDTDPNDGGWDWEIPITQTAHSEDNSPENTYGVIALGLIPSHLGWHTIPRFYTGMLDAYLGIENRTEVDSAPDFVFLTLFTHLSKNQGFVELAKIRYDDKIISYGGSLALAETIRDARGQEGSDGLIPFDLGWLAWAARLLDLAFPGQDYLEHAQIYGQVIADDIQNPTGYFDINDPHEPFYVLGIACAMHAMMLSNADIALVPVLRQKLLENQLPDGSWYYNLDYPDSDFQSTAYAVQKLSYLWPKDKQAWSAARAGSTWLAARQHTNGGWEYWTDVENPEVNAEILFAIFKVPPSRKPKYTTKKRLSSLPYSGMQKAKPPIAKPLSF